MDEYYKHVMKAPPTQIKDIQDIKTAVDSLMYYFNIIS